MAKRYGGKFSPQDTPASQDQPSRGQFNCARVEPAGVRTNVLFVPTIPLVFLSLNDVAFGMTIGLVAAGLLTATAFLLRFYCAKDCGRRPPIIRAAPCAGQRFRAK